jgi:HIV Tat-specific factor 1
VFDLADFERDPTLMTQLRDAIKAECAQFGQVKKVVVYDRSPGERTRPTPLK